MAKSDGKKEVIFNKYKDNLNLLIENNIIDGDKDVYICPITLDEHTSLEGEDPLSLEDAPQASLGGSSNILTNTSVNNICGFKIDNHLVERFKQLEQQSFRPNLEIPINFEVDGKIVRSTLVTSEDGNHQLKTHKKNNNPENLDSFVNKTEDGDVLDIQISKRNVDVNKAQIALLKNAYVLFFQKTGYAYIWDECFDTIRKQILNPERRIIPNKFYLNLPDNIVGNGVYFVKDKGLESVLVVFDLKYDSYTHKFGVFLPLGKNTLFKIDKNLTKRFAKSKGFNVLLQPIADDFLTDLERINEYAEWIDSIKL